MKQLLLLIVLSTLSLAGRAQVTSISEDFESCSDGSPHPNMWTSLDLVSSAPSQCRWVCGNTSGRWGTHGISCTGYYSGAFHLDTSYLITPILNISGYPDSVYLRFDTKTTNIILGGRLTVTESTDSAFDTTVAMVNELTALMTPTIGPDDSTDWVTHSINITSFKDISTGFYIAFRYTSSTTAGKLWYLDNVMTTNAPLHTATQYPAGTALHISATYDAGDQLHLFYTAPAAGDYRAAVYDMAGRVLEQRQVTINNVNGSIPFHTHLAPGMYIVRMGNDGTMATARVSVH